MTGSVAEPHIVSGGISVDDRGMVAFHNSIDLKNWRRFYFVSNHETGFVRAWHGHKVESKLAIPISGNFLLACVQIDNWENPDNSVQPTTFVLSATSPRALYIPAGFANGFKSLSPNSTIMFLSSSALDDSLSDDFRYPWNYWNPWESNFR